MGKGPSEEALLYIVNGYGGCIVFRRQPQRNPDACGNFEKPINRLRDQLSATARCPSSPNLTETISFLVFWAMSSIRILEG